jgi:hypothetical protein
MLDAISRLTLETWDHIVATLRCYRGGSGGLRAQTWATRSCAHRLKRIAWGDEEDDGATCPLRGQAQTAQPD